MAEAPDSLTIFRLEAPAQMPYIRIALTSRWQSEGRTVFIADTSSALPVFRYEIEEARVSYGKGPDHTLSRAVTLGVRYAVSGADGRLYRERRCRDTHSDVVSRGDLRRIESSAFPETQATPPESGWMRRFLEPAVITAATALGVYLFFSLRSDRADSGG